MSTRTDGTIELRVFTEPQLGADYAMLLEAAKATEELGYGAFFRSDHYLKMGDVSGEPGATDAWITLAGLARDTSTIRLGTLLTSNTFRHVGPLAVSVAQVDAMSGGRVELGLGAGWYDDEHSAFGIPLPTVRERFDDLEDSLSALDAWWYPESSDRSATFDFSGHRLELTDSPMLTRPLQERLPIIVGGHGKKRTPSLAARFADEFNVPFASAADTARINANVDAICAEQGRDPKTLLRSAAQVVCCGESNAEIERRAAAIGREPAELRENGLAGTPEEIIAKAKSYAAETGISRIYLQFLDLRDLDHLALVAEKVMPEL
ncbi:TIGR03560 family F420-dependent LLM class oxidoreductase [Dietzia sp.]|uniref:TIGR03560 family F420-dependent LLM class oxidoreductase n=1 Tax=Dietzia sp. TaxID=1871616 RepID=UPI002FDB36D9